MWRGSPTLCTVAPLPDFAGDAAPEDAEEEVVPRFRVRMVKQLGDLQQWYEILVNMKKTVFLK